MTVLVLAGTREARQLVVALVDDGIDVVASLAGRTTDAPPLACPTRVGGFGGVDGLVRELGERGITALVDATHPFADTMPLHARDAAARAGVPHVRLLRAAWRPRAGDAWCEVEDEREAAASLRAGERVLLALGRQQLDAFRSRTDVELVVRSVDAPPPGPWADVLLGRGPFTYDDERAVLRDHGIDALVTRNSGGARSKLDAAVDAGVRVVMIRRPPMPELATVGTVDDAVAWVRATLVSPA
jgi:precorrin-6A/cobalt-precorrin-6A reductase